jgi:hypothetical protein
VLRVVPELVSTDAQDGFKSVAYARATALIGAAVKELREEIWKELATLKQEINLLKVATQQ